MSMLYIHVPYCRRKCIYCDFFSGGASIADWDAYTRAVLTELMERKGELTDGVTSIYIGGGTPSLMPAVFFEILADGVKATADIRINSPDFEFTLECNPDDLSDAEADEKIESWIKAGVNRVSLGVQTFDDRLLKIIGRVHNGNTARSALDKLTGKFDNVSADLMFGLPGQTMDSLEADVEMLIRSGVKHISVYSLMYEEGTALTALLREGRIKEIDEELSADMYSLVTHKLRDAGFEHYEISNYAKHGRRSRHNSGYWRGLPYLGLGPSAHSYDGIKTRRSNPGDIRGYIAFFGNMDKIGLDTPYYKEEILTNEEIIEETVMLGLRVKEGIDLANYTGRFGKDEFDRLIMNAQRYIKDGFLDISEERLCLTERGVMVSDNIIVGLL